MSKHPQAPLGPQAMDVASIAEFTKGWQQQGLRRALAMGAPFFVVGAMREARKRGR